VSALATPAQADALRGLPGVERVVPVGRGRAGWQGEEQVPPIGNTLTGSDYGASQAQLDQIGITALHARGFTGRGVVIGILDTGFHRVHQAFLGTNHPLHVIAEHDFVNNDGNTDIEAGDPAGQHSHGTWILGTIASYLPGTLIGGAFEAQFVLCKTEVVPSETPIEEDYYVAGLEFIEAHGADVATSSLGYIDWYTQADLNGTTCVTTKAVNVATANGVVCCTAAGNEGHDANPATSTIIAPADALKVITCGAVNTAGAIAGFSSSGPTADGRVKPEILACGVSTQTIDNNLASGLNAVSGTSLSTPLVAAAMACIVQARPELTVDQLRAAVMTTASRSDSAGTHPDPLFVEGYGILRALDVARTGRVPADLNLDGRVNGADLGMLLGMWGTTNPPYGDLNGDGVINGADLGNLLGSWAP
jgi:subtilisin family serine protease